MPTPNTVLLKGHGLRKEYQASAAIMPGSLVEIINVSGVSKVRVHATAAGAAARMFALENTLVGKDLNFAYATGDNVQCEDLHAGCEVNALLAAAASAIVNGDKLESAGDGTLRKLAAGVPLAVAQVSVDNSAGGSQARIRVSIM